MGKKRPHLCLAASGGGHVRQLLDLEDLWRGQSYFFLTEDSALTRSLAEKHPCHFVAHVALGQARLGAPVLMLIAAIRNMIRSLLIIVRERPDVIITTGAGSCFFAVLWGRLTGARVILIDSFARFAAPSVFARIATPLASLRVAQSRESAENWPGAYCFDPFRIITEPRSEKAAQMFVTVGATLPFNRLVREVEKAKRDGLIPENIIMQTGIGGVRPDVPGIEVHETLSFDKVLSILRESDIVVCHGGTGSLITALREGCRVVAIPRSFERGEHYDDHQAQLTRAFEQRGLISVVDADCEFADALASARTREPVRATTDQSEMIGFLKVQLNDWQSIGAAQPVDGYTDASSHGVPQPLSK